MAGRVNLGMGTKLYVQTQVFGSTTVHAPTLVTAFGSIAWQSSGLWTYWSMTGDAYWGDIQAVWYKEHSSGIREIPIVHLMSVCVYDWHG